MLNNEKGQSLIEVLVVLVVASMMIIALIMIILTSLKNAQFAQNQTKATKIAQDTIDQIRILRDSNQNGTLTISAGSPACFKELWNSDSTNNFSCGGSSCYYKLIASPLHLNIESTGFKEDLGDGFSRQIKVNQTTPNDANNKEVLLIIEISWIDSTGEHNSNLETYLIKPNYECIE